MSFKSITFNLIFFTSTIFAQISGIVIDLNNTEPIVNVNITNGEVGAITNSNGVFFIDVPIGTNLEFSHIAYKNISLSAQKDMSVKLIPTVIESDQIIVSAGLSDESILNTVTSIHIFTDDHIRASGANNLQLLTEQIPNLNWAGGTSRPRYFQIRGIGERSHYFGEGPPNFSVGFVIDDMDFSGLGMIANLYDLDQIEIFRGPQSSVYGANALAGLISLKSNDPIEKYEVGISASKGSDNHFGINNYFNFKAIDGLNIRVTNSYNYIDGFRENLSRNISDTNKREEVFSRLKLKFNSNKKLNILATLIYSKLDNGYDAWAPNNNTDFKTYSDDKGMDSQTSYGYSLRTNINGNYNLTLITSFTKTNLEHSYDSDWGDSLYWATNHNWNPNSFPDSYYQYKYFDQNNKIRSNITHELRSSFGPVLFGFYFKDLNEKDKATGWLFDGAATDAVSDFHFKTIAAYSQYRFDFSSYLNFKANIRIEQSQFDYKGTSQGFNDNWEKVYLDTVQFKDTNRMIGYRAAITYHKNTFTSYYSSFSQGYKSGGINQQPYLTDSSRPFDPEFIQSFEFGLKRNTNISKTNITLFFSNRINQQVSVSSQQEEGNPNSFLFYIGNSGSGKNRGIEFDYSQNVLKSLSFDINIGVLDTWIDKFFYKTLNGQQYGGDREASMAPRFMGSLGLNFSISDYNMVMSTTYKSEYYFSDSHNNKSEPYSLTNITFGKSIKQFEVKLWVRNIFDKRYAVRGFYFGLIPPEYNDELWLSFGDPRQLGLTVDYKF
ncbi:MAG: TonB-dependent receptor [Candidatus Marinimicrobia bacterium]|nr:TonB-dependent receptor [Candidatus Neomarinimicrobiota bacterium]